MTSTRLARCRWLIGGSDVFFAATGVTDASSSTGPLHRRHATTESLVMRSRSGTVRTVKARHDRAKLREITAARSTGRPPTSRSGPRDATLGVAGHRPDFAQRAGVMRSWRTRVDHRAGQDREAERVDTEQRDEDEAMVEPKRLSWRRLRGRTGAQLAMPVVIVTTAPLAKPLATACVPWERPRRSRSRRGRSATGQRTISRNVVRRRECRERGKVVGARHQRPSTVAAPRWPEEEEDDDQHHEGEALLLDPARHSTW